MDGEPWCAMFVSWVFDQAGNDLNFETPKGFAYAPSGYSIGTSKGWKVDSPQAGDIIFFQFAPSPVIDHVGLVESVNGNTVTTIEGNTSDSNPNDGGAVQRKTHTSWVGLIRPPYTVQILGGDFLWL